MENNIEEQYNKTIETIQKELDCAVNNIVILNKLGKVYQEIGDKKVYIHTTSFYIDLMYDSICKVRDVLKDYKDKEVIEFISIRPIQCGLCSPSLALLEEEIESMADDLDDIQEKLGESRDVSTSEIDPLYHSINNLKKILNNMQQPKEQ